MPPKFSKSGKATTLISVLSQIQLQQYLPLFQRNEIDFSTFLTLNEQALKTVGIKNDSHRKLLLIYIRKLQQLLLPSPITATQITNSMFSESTEDDSAKVSIEAVLTPITEEDEEHSFPETSSYVTDVTQPNGEETNVKARATSQDNLSINEPSPTTNTDNDFTQIRSRKHFSTDSEDLLALKRQRNVSARDSTWRLSTPVTMNELPPLPPYHVKLPSYYDVIDRQCIQSCEEAHEELPPYSCSVYKSGYVLRKNEFTSKGYRARDRSWKKLYLYLWGTFLRIYKSEPIDINRVSPSHEFSMQNVQVGLATDYNKKSNVIRVRIPSGYQFLFQVQDHSECVAWIEKLQSSANIAPTLDEREMPMFITLPMRRRRVGIASSVTTSSSSSLSSFNSVNYEGITIINNNSSSAPISASGLTFQQFNDIARELQQVQITQALPQQQLSW